MATNQPAAPKHKMQKRQLHNMQPEQKQQQHRESIWSVPTGWRIAYFALFTLFSNVGLVIMLATLEMPSDLAGWSQLVIGIIKDMAFIGAGSAIIAIMITENARYTMILAEWMLREVIEPRRKRQIERWRQEGIEKGRQEGIAEGRQEGIEQGIDRGRAEANKEWESWIRRKMQAEANGETFDEPMPTHRNGTG